LKDFNNEKNHFLNDRTEIFNWLDNNQVMEEICGADAHPELLSRSAEFIKILYGGEKSSYLT
jgi:hypothetical protein